LRFANSHVPSFRRLARSSGPNGNITLEFTMDMASLALPTWSINGQSVPEIGYVVVTS